MSQSRNRYYAKATFGLIRRLAESLIAVVKLGYDRARQFGLIAFGRNVRWQKRLTYMAAGATGLGVFCLTVLMLYAFLLIPFTPGISEIRKVKAERPTVVYSADGVLLTEFKPVNRHWVDLDQIAPEVRMALIATEDHRFYEHNGVDLRRMVSAAIRTICGDRQGASTITQQLARNLYPKQIGTSPTLTRKLKELITTFKIEAVLSKEEILETYLNTVPFLYDAYGIEMAARTYFSVSAAELTIEQAATLVGMLKGTDFYNPVRRPERALERRNLVLRQMVRHDYLQEDRYDLVASSGLNIRFQRQPRMRSDAPHFTEHVRRWLNRWARRSGYNIYRDSLVVHTTLDTRLQAVATQSVDRWMPVLQSIAEAEWSRPDARLISRSPTAYAGYRRSQPSFSHLWDGRPDLVNAFIRGTPQYRAGTARGIAAEAMIDSLRNDAYFMAALRELKTRLEVGFVAVQPATGQVVAWVGSRSYDEVPYDHVAMARRQPGSTFKPIVYAAALERGYRPHDTLPDTRVEIRLRNGHIWSPVNAGGRYSEQEMTLADGLAQSKNTITAQLIDRIGVGTVARTADRMGISRSRLDEVPSLALGTSEVTLLELTSAFATLANAGVHVEPVVVERIEDRRGRVLYEARPKTRRAIREETALRVVNMMRGVVDRGTGTRIRTTFGIREEMAGKTGTTQGNMDGWFVNMHPDLVAGAWVGFSDPRVSFRTDYWGAGGNNALLVVGEFYRRAFRHPETRLVGTRFAEAPGYTERSTILTHVGEWFSAGAEWVGGLISGAVDWVADRFRDVEEDDAPAESPRAARPLPPPAIDFRDEILVTDADSDAQAQRDSIRLNELIERIRRMEDELPSRPLILEPRSIPTRSNGENEATGEPEELESQEAEAPQRVIRRW